MSDIVAVVIDRPDQNQPGRLVRDVALVAVADASDSQQVARAVADLHPGSVAVEAAVQVDTSAIG